MKRHVLLAVALLGALWLVRETLGGGRRSMRPGVTVSEQDLPLESTAGTATLQGAARERDARSALARDGVLEGGSATAPAPEVPPPADASLHVHVRWSDGAPAADVQVVVRTTRESHGVLTHERRATGPDGVAAFVALPSGALHVCTDHTGWEPLETLELAPGEVRDVTVDLPAGLAVEGVVLDADGAPVADAGIWLTSRTGGWTSGAIVARADGGGRFALRDVPLGPSLGALADGYRPSALVDLEQVDRSVTPVRVELRIALGGAALVGRVTDADGAPVADAVVAVGEDPGHFDQRADGTTEEHWRVRATCTDAHGDYRLVALEAGEVAVAVRPPRAVRPPLGVRSARVTLVEGQTTRHDVTLLAAAVVVGRVTTEAGEPVVGGAVRAFAQPLDESFLQSGQVDDDGPFQHVAALTDAAGSYRLERIPAGVAYLYAQAPLPRDGRMGALVPYTKTTRELAAGGRATWDAVLGDGLVIAGAARYRDGAPIENVFVNLTRSESGASEHRALHTTDGTFRFVQLEDALYDVRVQLWEKPPGSREPRALGVRPGGAPLELVADFDAPVEHEAARVTLRFLDGAGRAPGQGALGVLLEPERGGSWRPAERDGERFVFEVDEPGRYRVVAVTGERPIFASELFTVTAGQTIDLGTLESVAGAELVVALPCDDAHPPRGVRVSVRYDACVRAETLELEPGAQDARFTGLLPGGATVEVRGDNVVDAQTRVMLDALRAAAVEVPLVAALAVPYEIARAPGTDPGGMTIRFVDRSTGDEARRVEVADLMRYRNPLRWTARLAPGAYTFEVTLGDGRVARQEFDVTSLDPASTPVLRVEF